MEKPLNSNNSEVIVQGRAYSMEINPESIVGKDVETSVSSTIDSIWSAVDTTKKEVRFVTAEIKLDEHTPTKTLVNMSGDIENAKKTITKDLINIFEGSTIFPLMQRMEFEIITKSK